MSRYAIQDPVLTLVGEGGRAGSKVVSIGFVDCNLWNGRPMHRDTGAAPCAEWCDMDFRRGRPLTADEIVGAAGALWAPGEERWVLFTGGEPTLQLDKLLVIGFHQYEWKIMVETNGSVACEALDYADYVVVSPKLGTDYTEPKFAHEVRVTLPGAAPGRQGWSDHALALLETDCGQRWPMAALYVTPQDPLVDPTLVSETALRRSVEVHEDREAELEAQLRRNIGRCMSFVGERPKWRMAAPAARLLGYPR